MSEAVQSKLNNKLVGGFIMLFSSVIFVYYSIWILVLPFYPLDHWLWNYFPSLMYAILIPNAILWTAFGIFCIGLLVIVYGEKMKEKKKAKVEERAKNAKKTQ